VNASVNKAIIIENLRVLLDGRQPTYMTLKTFQNGFPVLQNVSAKSISKLAFDTS
jgi:hypothetical protein